MKKTTKALIRLDIGCGANKQGPTWLGMDVRKLPGVDIVHDLETYPWPLKSESCSVIVAGDVLEHISREDDGVIRFFNEAWRVLAPGGEFLIAAPYGTSELYAGDPTHKNPVVPRLFGYFCPEHPQYADGLWNFYRPLPWKLRVCSWAVNGRLEAAVAKLPVNGNEDKGYMKTLNDHTEYAEKHAKA